MRTALWEISSLPRIRSCGRVSMCESGEVYLRARGGDDRNAGYGGLVTCGSVWCCPTCAAKIGRQRVDEVAKALTWNDARGGTTALATFTVQHHAGQSLSAVWDAVADAWRSMTTGSAGYRWRKVRKALGQDQYVRVTEVTHGKNGWHVHLHLVLLFDGDVSDDTCAAMADHLYSLWVKALATAGMTASRRHGVDVRRCTAGAALETVAEYLEKMALEVAGGVFKKGRKGGRSPFQILRDGLSTGLADDLELWLQWEAASKGRRQMVWSRGLKGLVAVAEMSDEEIAAAAEEGSETLVVLPRRTWRAMRERAIDLLEVTEADGIAGAMLWLEDRGLFYEVPDVTCRSRAG